MTARAQGSLDYRTNRPNATSTRLVDRYLTLRATRLARASLAAYRADLLDLARFLGPRSVVDASPEEIAAWFSANLRRADDPDDARRWCARTAHRRYAALSRFYAWARRSGLLEGNPLDGVELPRTIRPEPVLVSREHVNRLLAMAESLTRADVGRDLAILDVAILQLMDRLALRVSEAVNVRLSSVTTVAGELHVRIMKKGNKPKTYPLSGVVRDAYERWIDVRRSVDVVPEHRDFAFIDPRTGRHVSRQLVWARIKRLGNIAGLPSEVVDVLSPHKLRHARARTMLRDGWDIAAVQSVLDHASIQTTQIYVGAPEDARLEALRALSGIRCGSVPNSA